MPEILVSVSRPGEESVGVIREVLPVSLFLCSLSIYALVCVNNKIY